MAEIRKYLLIQGMDSDPSKVGLSVTPQGDERAYDRSALHYLVEEGMLRIAGAG